MLSIKAGESAEAIRTEIREWLTQTPPPRDVSPDGDLDTFIRESRRWQKKLCDSRFIAVHWPIEFGGRGLSFVEEAIIQEELGRAGAPQVLGLFGLTMVGPVLIRYGSEDQKRRYLSKILSAEEIWCQGFSEPEAGSDLANVKSRAVKTEGGFLLTGQKIWTSFAHVADFIFVLARTSDEEKKHKGLTYFLMPIDAPGISVRPLRQITGDAEFNEVFFDSVFIPEDQIVGGLGQGWEIAISTLMYERLVLTFARHIQSEQALRSLLQNSGTLPNAVKSQLAQEVVTAAATRALAYKHLHIYAKGETPGAQGSLDKLLWSTSFQRISKIAVDATGMQAAFGTEQKNEAAATAVQRYLYSRGRTIAAGTSEIQRNIIAERLLKLPKK